VAFNGVKGGKGLTNDVVLDESEHKDDPVPNIPTPTEKSQDGAHPTSAPAPTSTPDHDGRPEIESPLRRDALDTPDQPDVDGRPEIESPLHRDALDAERQNDTNGGDPPRTPTPERDPFEGMRVLSPLRRKIFAKVASGSNIGYEVRQLHRLSSYELARENNIAKNREMLVSLGLDKSFDEMMAIKRKAGEKKGGRRAAKRARKGHGEDSN
jgi:hypothetical protein